MTAFTNNGGTLSGASGGETDFFNTSTAGSATITNNGATVFGVSAQGGDYARDKDKLTSNLTQSERILVEGPGCAPHDLAGPIRWLLG